MATFALFNYQFDKIVERSKQYVMEGMDSVLMSAEEAFPKRQEIFGDLLLKDYKKATSDDVIHFKNQIGLKEYIHRHIMRPTDDIVIMRVANRKTQKIVDIDLHEKKIEDYQNCIVIIDNRPGIQRILIENKKAAFSDVRQLARILTYTFNALLSRYSLKIRLDHLQDDRDFWHYVNDKNSHPNGFYKIRFNLPYPNLSRLKKVYDRLFKTARESFDSGINMELVASEGGRLRLDQNDVYQKEIVEYMMKKAGAVILLYPKSSNKSSILVGEQSYLVVTISNSIFNKLVEEATNSDLFGGSALDEVKRKTKTGIDPE